MNKIVSNLSKDIPASIVVFLVALPLCLGVALASGAPLMSGIISGIIGGIVVGLISKSPTSVSGPAAGLAAVVLSSISQLGSFELFLTAVIIAGVFQLIMGFARLGFIANYIPSSVIKGLLAAIGIILILKQIPHALGVHKTALESFAFKDSDGENTFSALISALELISPSTLIISAISIFILIIWSKTPLAKIKIVPSSLFVVVFGVVLNALFRNFFPSMALEETHLVNIPPIDANNMSGFLHLPGIGSLGNYQVWVVAFTIAVIATLETLLNIEAVEKIDPHKRKANPNNELVAQGIGNMFSGLLGGIPITSVIVRSSVNIQSGNETKLSTILHGILILVSVLILSPVLNQIPLASLAAILLITGYKLAKLPILKEMYDKGWDQFIPTVVTTLSIIFTDLLIGVIIGLAVSLFYLLRSNYRNPFTKEKNKLQIGEVVKIDLPNQVSFFNKAAIKETLWNIPAGTKVLIDASHSDFIDNDVIEIITDFKNIIAQEKNIQLNIFGLKEKYKLIDHIEFINVLDKETQEKLKPEEIMQFLKEGNERFINGKWSDKHLLHQVNATSLGQNPMAVIVGCIDSRTSPELLFDANIGDILTVRIAGNIVSPEIIGSLEIAVSKIGAKLIVVKGHSKCGAVALSIKNSREGKICVITDKVQKSIDYVKSHNCSEDDDDYAEKIAKENVINSIEEIIAGSPILKEKIINKEIGIVSAYHDIATGKVHFDELKIIKKANDFINQKEYAI